jgi:uncharacterized protein DUF6166
MSNKLYRGIRQGNVAKVFVDNEELSLEPSKILHPSDATPEFGYFGDGPSQLSLAILFDATQDKENSLKYYHHFKYEFIAPAPYETGFTILQSQVIEWLARYIEANNKKGPDGWVI